MKRKILAVLLAAAMVFGLFGCTNQPQAEADNTEPSSEAPPAPEPAEVYAEARAALDNLAAVTLDVELTTTTTVEDQNFVEESEQVLTYAGLDTDSPMVWLTKEVPYNAMEEEEEDTDEEQTRTYSEIYADGTLYVELKDEATFSGSLSAEEYSERYVPVVLLDASLYGELTMEESGDQTTIHFDAPTAAESWALPEDALLLDASGSAVVGADGKLQQMHYTVTYSYGSVEVTMEVESEPRMEALTVVVPEDTDKYLPLQCVDALQMILYSDSMLKQVTTASVTSTNSAISYAAGATYTQSINMNMHGTGDKLMAKIESGTHVSDPYNGVQSLFQEETYQDGKYVIVVDGGIPTSQVGIKDDIIREYCDTVMANSVATPNFWQDVTVTDLGSVYLLEFIYTEDFGNSIQNAVNVIFWQNPTFLNSLASNYENKEMTGYLAIDKYTGLITSSGLSYEGVHTIEGKEWSLTMQKNQDIEIPAFGAHKAITGKLQAETKPEQMPTPLFYHVTGEEGQEMWLLGTIHVGDERTGNLPQEIYDAFAASDALALECDTEAFEEQIKTDSSLQNRISKAYYYRDDSVVADYLDEELYDLAVQYLKASGDYSTEMDKMRVALWESSISNFYLQQGHQLHTEQGLESRLTQLAKEQEKPIREVESSIFQLELQTGWSNELQKLMLEEILSNSAEEYWLDTYELYELWCGGDEEALRRQINEEPDTADMTDEERAEYEAALPLLAEYDKAMSYDRNEDMLDVAIDYLESGEVVFYAVGLAHLLDGTNGLVDALREAGYTVEPVTYYQ